MEMLGILADPKFPPLKLKEGKWDTMFDWLEESMLKLSKSKPGEKVKLDTVKDWAETEI